MIIRKKEAREATEMTLLVIFLGSILSAFFAIIFAYLLFSAINRNLQVLIHGTQEIAANNFTHSIVVDSNDAFSILAKAFNDMSFSLDKSIKEVEASAQIKSDFLANMSHEIRTPMNGIIGMLSLMEQSELTEDQQYYLRNIRTCGDGLLVVLNDILDISKLEAGKLELEYKAFDLKQMVDEYLYWR